MKVHIINLEPDDDHASTRDKLSSASAPKVVLVWPRHGQPLARRLDLAVVKRHADRLGLELGLVTFEPDVVSHADRLSIPVFESLDRPPSGTWTEPSKLAIPHREHASLDELRQARDADDGALINLGDRGRRIAVGISIAAVLAIAISVLPKAEILMEPARLPLEENLNLWVDPQTSPAFRRVPGQTISAEISGTRRVDTTGQVRLPQTAAVGQVEISNLTSEEISVPEETGLRAGEIRYLTTDEVQIESSEGSSVTVGVVAAEAGLSGNVGAGSIDSVEGPLGFLIAVGNPEPIRGGLDQVTAAVSLNDMEELRQELEFELLETAESALLTQLEPGFELVPGSLRISDVVTEQFDVGLGEAADSLGLSLTLSVEGLGYLSSRAMEVVEQEIISSLPANRVLVPGSLSLEPIKASSDWPAMEVLFAIGGAMVESVDRDLLRRSIAGDPKDQAASRLLDLLQLEHAPEIQTTPSWMPWVPWLGMRIDVKWAWESA